MSALPLTSPDSSAALPAPHSAWWRHLFVESDDAQLVCDRDGAVCEVNRRAVRLFGITVGASLFHCPMLAPGAVIQLREALGRGTDRTETVGTVGITCVEGGCLVADLQLMPLDEGAGCW